MITSAWGKLWRRKEDSSWQHIHTKRRVRFKMSFEGKTTLYATVENAPFVIRDVAESGTQGDYKIVVTGVVKNNLFWKYVTKKVAYPSKCRCTIELDLSAVEGLSEISVFHRYSSELYSYDDVCYFDSNPFPVTSVILPDSVMFIDKEAFAMKVDGAGHVPISKLESIHLPSSVQFIARSAFANCKNLKSVSIPGSVAFIARGAFSGCTGLESASIAQGVKAIARGAFSGCTALDHITIPGSTERIVKNTFAGCTGLKAIEIADGLKAIEAGAFGGCKSLESIAIPASVETIGDQAFASCTSLKSIEIAEGLKAIEAGAFGGCKSLESIAIPASTKRIDFYAFIGCENLSSITYAGTMEQWTAIEIVETTPSGATYERDYLYDVWATVACSGDQA